MSSRAASARNPSTGTAPSSVAARLVVIYFGFGLNDPWTYRFFPFELAFFIAGVFSHRWLLSAASRLASNYPDMRVDAWAVGCCVIAFTSFFLWPMDEAVNLALLFAITFFALPFLFQYQEKAKYDKWIGDLSFPLYIGHLLALLTVAFLVKKYQFVDPLSLMRTGMSVGAALAFALVLKELVADPIEKLRKAVKRTGKDHNPTRSTSRP